MIGWVRGRTLLVAFATVKHAVLRWANWARVSHTLHVHTLRVVRHWLRSRQTAAGRWMALELVFVEL